MGRKLVSFDWALKRLLRSKVNFGILEGFLSELLMEDIKILEVLESESNKESKDDKSNRVDLKVKDAKGEIVIIEVQYEQEWDYLQRILYIASKAITEHIDEGDIYKKVAKVISINILYFDLGHGSDYIYHGTTSFYGIHDKDELRLSENQKESLKKENISQIFPEYYLLKVNNFDDKAKTTLDEWMYFLKNQTIKKNFKAKGLKEAQKKLDVMLLPDNKRAEYEAYVEERRHQKSLIWTAETKGKVEGKVEDALNMLNDGLTVDKVCQYTGLPKSEVEKLVASLDKNSVKERAAPFKTTRRKRN